MVCSYQCAWNMEPFMAILMCLYPHLQASCHCHFCSQCYGISQFGILVGTIGVNNMAAWAPLVAKSSCLVPMVQFMAAGWYPSSAITLYNNGGWLWRTCCRDFWTMFWWQASMSPHLVVFHYHYLWVIYCKSKDTNSLCPFAVVECDVGKSLWQQNCCMRNYCMAWRLVDAPNNQPVAGICWCHLSEGF